MELKEVMEQQIFAVAGDTLNEEKFAYKIKSGLISQGYTAYGVGKELASINDVPGEIDIIDLCINSAKGLALMQECRKKVKCVVIQPGAGSDELVEYLNASSIPWIESCVLVGLREYGKGR